MNGWTQKDQKPENYIIYIYIYRTKTVAEPKRRSIVASNLVRLANLANIKTSTPRK